MESLLRTSGLQQHNALVIGAGLASHPMFYWLELSPEHQLFQGQYSFEYLEIAALLTRLGKPWRLTVVDSSSEVCDAVTNQESVVINNLYDQTGYARMFLSTFGAENDKEGMSAINSALESVRTTNRPTLFKRLEIPRMVRERIKVVNGTAGNLDTLLGNEQYDVVTCFYVARYMEIAELSEMRTALHAIVKQGGVVASDFSVRGFVEARPPQKQEYEEEDTEGNKFLATHTTFLLKKPPALESLKP